jgi:hypothetical protein
MKVSVFVLFLLLSQVSFGQERVATPVLYEFSQVTTIESVVPGGLGRSRMITSGKDGAMEEVKLENFFSFVGINFENVRNNDKTITDKITRMYEEGWELINTASGVYSADKSTGIFITRYLFRRVKVS